LFAEELPLEEVTAVSEVSAPATMRKLAILSFRTTHDRYPFIGGEQSYTQVTHLLRRSCAAAFGHTNRFDIVSSDDLKQLLKDNHIESFIDGSVVSQLEAGKVLGLDYILVGTVIEAREALTPYLIQVSGEQGHRYNGSLVVDYQVLVVATGEVKWADSIKVKLDHATMQKLTPQLEPDQFQQYLFTKAAEQIAHNVVADIYPLRVVRTQQKGEVIVNHGEGLVESGQWYDVFEQGDDVYDPQTGESLGTAEVWVATIKIKRVTDKVAYGTVIDGEVLLSAMGARCQLKDKKEVRRKKPGRISDVQPTIDGGVVLPFD
jgi:hypothetical protein